VTSVTEAPTAAVPGTVGYAEQLGVGLRELAGLVELEPELISNHYGVGLLNEERLAIGPVAS
jgi:hypothetical protein